jgi:adenylosuccinate synthase
VGWFDAVMARYAVQINGIDTLAITKFDVLDTLPTVKVCVGYRLNDTQLEFPPATVAVLEQAEPIYEELPGWMTPTAGIRRFAELPEAAQAYLARICQLAGARLGLVTVGPERDQVIQVADVF